MNTLASTTLRALGVGIAMLLPILASGHPGHGAPSVHAHTGSPSMLAVLGIVALGVASLAGLARLVLRRRRLRRQR